jgi:LysR family transcriptional regulator, regulator for metE and metH
MRIIVCLHRLDELSSYIMEVQLEVRHLKLLAAIADTGSVTEAGKRLYLTQSALSHQLRDAEEMLGTALFLRLGKKMVLTAAGESLLATARHVLDELRCAETRIHGLNGGTRGVVRLSTECYTCYHWLPPVLKKFHSQYSDVQINIDAASTNRPIEALLDGGLDVAIVSTPPKNKSLRATPMFEDLMVLVMSPDHRLTEFENVPPRELAGETVLIYPPKEDSTLMGILRSVAVEPERILEIPLTEAIVELAAAGTGIALLPRWAVSPQVDSGRVVVRPLSSKGVVRRWYAVTLRNQKMPAYLAEFLELLEGCCPKYARRWRPAS